MLYNDFKKVEDEIDMFCQLETSTSEIFVEEKVVEAFRTKDNNEIYEKDLQERRAQRGADVGPTRIKYKPLSR